MVGYGHNLSSIQFTDMTLNNYGVDQSRMEYNVYMTQKTEITQIDGVETHALVEEQN